MKLSITSSVTALVLLFGFPARSFSQVSPAPAPAAINRPANDGQLSGKVIDGSTSRPVDFASVALINKVTGKTARTAQTDTSGNFKILAIPYGNYRLRISFIGYKPFSRELQFNLQNRNVALGTIRLPGSQSKVLQEVVVQAQRNSIQLGIDRKIFNVQQSLVSEGGSATDLLANVPSISVDPDGNVSLRGTNNVRILIDGKPSAMLGNDVAQALQSIPASAIQNIEVITNPSSKYDPEGQSGIINIVLKKNQKLGLNGVVAVTGGSQNNYNANTNLNYRNNGWNLYGSYSFRRGNRLGGGFNNTNFFNADSLILNNSSNQRTNLSNTGRLGVEYSPSEKTTIGLSGNLSVRKNDRNEDLNYQYFSFLSASGTSYRSSRQDESDNGYDLTLDFSQKFKRRGEELSANVSYGKDKEDGLQNLDQNFYTMAGSQLDTVDRRINDTYEDGDHINLQLDYTLPFNPSSKLEAGYRTIIRNNKESQLSDRLNPVSNVFQRDYSLTNDFNLRDEVHAVYVNYQNTITKQLGFQVGLRAEQAYLNTGFIATDSTNARYNTPGNLDYFRVYPSVFLTQHLKGENQLQLSYSRRVNRPRGWQINPFRDISDPNNIRVGNPNLKPEDVHSFEFSYANFWKSLTLTSSIYFRQVNDVVQGIRLAQPDNNAATITEFFNLSRNQASGFEFISRLNLTQAVNLTGNLNLFYNRFSAINVGDYHVAGTDGYSWNANVTADFRFPKNVSAQLRADYSAPQNIPQGRRREMYGVDAAIRMDFLKGNKGTLSLNVRNLLNSRKWSGFTETAFFTQDFERMWQKRMANLTFSYRFGKDAPQKNRRNNRDQQQQEEPQEEGGF